MSQAGVRAQQERARVVTVAALRAAEALGLPGREVGKVIGVSEPSVSRVCQGDYRLQEGARAFELAALLVRLFRSLDAITAGDPQVARAWLRNENRAPGGKPLARIQANAV